MTALVNYTIPKRNFELIRDRIGQILFIELDNQYRRYNPAALVNGVYVERKRPIDKDEVAIVNVGIINATFDSKSQGNKQAEVQYYIDIYTKKPSTVTSRGDSDSQIFMERLLGICDYILEDPQYKTLGFPPGAIGHTEVTQLNVRDQDMADADNIAMGRLVMNVSVTETNSLLSGRLLQNNITTFNLFYGTQGYQFID